jgi:hypothetical protein
MKISTIARLIFVLLSISLVTYGLIVNPQLTLIMILTLAGIIVFSILVMASIGEFDKENRL